MHNGGIIVICLLIAVVIVAFLARADYERRADERAEQMRRADAEAESDARMREARKLSEQRHQEYLERQAAIRRERYAAWEAWAEEASKLTTAARNNPPEDLIRIVWDQGSHAYMIKQWWVMSLEDQNHHLKTSFSRYYEPGVANWRHVRGYGYDGEERDHYDPPGEAKAFCGYRSMTKQRFPTVREAEHWLRMELHPDENQRGYDADGRHITDEVVPLKRRAIDGLPLLVLGSASGVIDDEDEPLIITMSGGSGGGLPARQMIDDAIVVRSAYLNEED